MNNDNPIGIFDSGIGGLTIARALVDELPNESIFYFGDTAHFPYGDKSHHAIQNYSLRIADLMLEKGCKMILIACGTASSVAYDLLKKHVGDSAIVVNVIDPVVTLLDDKYDGKKVGLIATRLTVNSNVYRDKILSLNSKIDFQPKATPLLVSAIEEGFYETNVIDEILEIYLRDPKLSNIDALILACTHFPLVFDKVKSFYGQDVDIIDPSRIVAKKVRDLLAHYSLLNLAPKSTKHFYISDYTESFAASAKRFFGQNIKVEAFMKNF